MASIGIIPTLLIIAILAFPRVTAGLNGPDGTVLPPSISNDQDSIISRASGGGGGIKRQTTSWNGYGMVSYPDDARRDTIIELGMPGDFSANGAYLWLEDANVWTLYSRSKTEALSDLIIYGNQGLKSLTKPSYLSHTKSDSLIVSDYLNPKSEEWQLRFISKDKNITIISKNNGSVAQPAVTIGRSGMKISEYPVVIRIIEPSDDWTGQTNPANDHGRAIAGPAHGGAKGVPEKKGVK